MPQTPKIFKPGDHLRVFRGYFHHGIYVGDDQVIQFGGGVFDKANARIGRGPLKEFANGGGVQAVRHKDNDADMTVRRATWLLENPPPRSYSLVGFNCEHVARWCANGWETESYQTRTVFGAKAAIGVPLQLWIAVQVRTGAASLPRRR